ncbi:MAG: type II secretory pathway component PulF, partial [Gammaproteobacteria bacterium]
MPDYVYKGRGRNGQLVDGKIEGVSNSGVASVLMDQGVTPISIIEKKV